MARGALRRPAQGTVQPSPTNTVTGEPNTPSTWSMMCGVKTLLHIDVENFTLSSHKSICSCGHTTSSGVSIVRMFSNIIANNSVRACYCL